MSVIRVKPGVAFTVIAPGGFRILSVLQFCADFLGHDLTITSACDGEHSGPDDPHHRGEAFDIRTKDIPDKQLLAERLQAELGSRFYAFVEDEGTDNEHVHVQVSKGTVYP